MENTRRLAKMGTGEQVRGTGGGRGPLGGMMRIELMGLLSGLVLLSAGCTEVVNCSPGATQMCVCAGGASGAQTCNAEGDAWGTCSCIGPDEDAGGGDTDAGGGGDDAGGGGTDAGDSVDAGGEGGEDAGGGGTDAGGGGTDAGTDAGEPPGPSVMCAMTSRTATATLQEGGGASSATLAYYSGGALLSIDGMMCMPDSDRTGERGDCFDPYICGTCRILIFYTGSNRTMIGECPAYSGFYSISAG